MLYPCPGADAGLRRLADAASTSCQSLQPSRHATRVLPRPTAALVPSRLIRSSIGDNSRTRLRIKNR